MSISNHTTGQMIVTYTKAGMELGAITQVNERLRRSIRMSASVVQPGPVIPHKTQEKILYSRVGMGVACHLALSEIVDLVKKWCGSTVTKQCSTHATEPKANAYTNFSANDNYIILVKMVDPGERRLPVGSTYLLKGPRSTSTRKRRRQA